jgi:hypothetical protein
MTLHGLEPPKYRTTGTYLTHFFADTFIYHKFMYISLKTISSANIQDKNSFVKDIVLIVMRMLYLWSDVTKVCDTYSWG